MTQLAQAAPAEAANRTPEIAALNDAARAGTLPTSRIVLTRTLCDLIAGLSEDPAVRQTRLYEGKRALHRLINETPIDPGNDPYGERDFGVVQFLGRPCPGGQCSLGLSYLLDLDKITFQVRFASDPVFEDLAKQARAAGIKWITYGSKLQNEDAQVGFRQYEDGVPLGQAAGKWINEQLGGKAKVAILGYEQGDWGRRRGQGIVDGLKQTAPGAEIVAKQDAISPTEGLNTTRTLLQAHPDLNVILGVEDPATEGAYQAWTGSGKKKDDPKMFIGGMDGTPTALKLLSEGDTVYRASMAIPLIKLGDGIASTSQTLVCGQPASDLIIPLDLVTPGSPLASQYLKDQGAG